MTIAKKEKVGMNLEQDTKYLEKGRAKIGGVLYTPPFYCEFVGLGRRFPSIYAVIRRIFEGFLGRSI